MRFTTSQSTNSQIIAIVRPKEKKALRTKCIGMSYSNKIEYFKDLFVYNSKEDFNFIEFNTLPSV